MPKVNKKGGNIYAGGSGTETDPVGPLVKPDDGGLFSGERLLRFAAFSGSPLFAFPTVTPLCGAFTLITES